ncbi:MAG: O-methyltransferase [Candidatus Shikimatogenerans sp. Tduv]|uniref:Class I SAM-dependent methyltransferase n=1 Tax=Candidatus Shikimatogenerans sp. Tduv TaxID=3158567 RepID=A0AAU7QTL6_9FLAO
MINNNIYKYIKKNIKTNKLIKNYYFYIKKNYKKLNLNIKIMSNIYQGTFLNIISFIKKPKYILELGSYIGFSTICLYNKYIKKYGKLITIEKNKKIYNLCKKFIKKFNLKNIKIINNNILNILNKLKYKFDIIFIDANKKKYKKYFKILYKKKNKNGIIITDNTLWKKKIINKNIKKKSYENVIKKYNKYIKKKSKLNIILPIRDGLTITI